MANETEAMDSKLIARFDAARDAIKAELAEKHPDSYDGIFAMLCRHLTGSDGGYSNPLPDPERITAIDHGDYQGTRVFVVGETGYQPSTYWIALIGYGSCSGCDTFEGIRSYDDGKPSEQQAADYFTLALHMVQAMRRVA